MVYLLGLDLGTSSVKAVLFTEQGQPVGMAQQPYEIDIPQPGHAEQHPEVWWEAAASVTRQAIAASGVHPDAVRAVGLSGQMHGLVAVDAQHKPVRPAIIWCDQRTADQVQEIYRLAGEEQIARITLNPIAAGFLLPSLRWVKQFEPERYRSIHKVMLPKDYVRLRLCGALGTELSDAAATGAFDNTRREWSDALIEAAELDRELFPEVRLPQDIAGTVHAAAAAATGLREGTPVVYGGADQPMQALGSGIAAKGAMSITIGTGGQVFTLTDTPAYDPKLRMHTFCNAVPDTWYHLGATLNAGLSLQWLTRNILHQTDLRQLNEAASAVPAGSEGLIFLPYLTGERTPHMDPHAKGMFFGLTLQHNASHMVRAVMEGVAFSLRDAVELMGQLGTKPASILAAGGGAQSPLWRQILADLLGMPIRTTMADEQACLGAAITAAVGTGMYRTFEEACRAMTEVSSTATEPDRTHKERYDAQYATYRTLYEQNKMNFPRG